MAGRFGAEFGFRVQSQGSGLRQEDVPTLRIVILADLHGRAGREAEGSQVPIAQRRFVPVDVDNFDQVLARMELRLQLRLGDLNSQALPLVFRSLDDFHPDALHRGLELFGPLRDVRRRLLDASTFATAAAEWSRAVGLAMATGPESSGRSLPQEDDEAVRRRLLGRGSADVSSVSPAQVNARAGLDRLLREIVGPHVVPSPDPRQPELLRSVDEAAAGLLRRILRHPDFQALEGVWRSIHGLVVGLEADAGVELRLLDVTKAEIDADGAAGASGLERALIGREAAEDDAASVWTVLVAAFTFGPGEGDVTLLERLGTLASRAGGPLLAAGGPAIVGCRSLGETPDPRDWEALDTTTATRWRRLRESAVAPWIGLAMPRVLLRLPYGTRTDPIEAFDFEELPPGRDHEAYLWGNPAFACARLIASSFVENGTAMEPGDHLELDDLPAAVYDDEEGPRLKPCAETALTEAAARRILDAGVMPLLASSRRNVVHIMRFQSIADPPRPLAGRWGDSSPPAGR